MRGEVNHLGLPLATEGFQQFTPATLDRRDILAGSPVATTIAPTIQTALSPSKARKRERVRCSSFVDWLVYPLGADTMRASNDAQMPGRVG